MGAASFKELNRLLKDVSRSFYLTVRVLPGKVRHQIGLAYLLARATDTIADTEIVPIDERLDSLARLRSRILGTSIERLDFSDFTRNDASLTPGERCLLEGLDDVLASFEIAAPSDQALIRRVIETITSGQELDLRRFGGANEANIVALQTEVELDDYTYRVAGCVGEFWTRICRAHLLNRTSLDDATLIELGIRFGKGLQLVNILRDLPRDLRLGRCYLPADRLAAAGLLPTSLLDLAVEAKLRPVFNACLDLAQDHLTAGWHYTTSLPFTQIRLRLACAWPILIGVETISKLRQSPLLDPNHRVKVSRRELRQIMLGSLILYPWPGRWKNLFGSLQRRACAVAKT